MGSELLYILPLVAALEAEMLYILKTYSLLLVTGIRL